MSPDITPQQAHRILTELLNTFPDLLRADGESISGGDLLEELSCILDREGLVE